MTTNGTPGGGGRKRSDESREAAAVLFASGASVSEVAGKLSIGETTLHRWRRQPAFSDRVRQLRSDMTTETLSLLAKGSRQAATQLIELLDDASAAIRLGAAGSLLKHLLNFKDQTDLADRITAIERRLEEGKGRNIW
jgi:transposase-like protein